MNQDSARSRLMSVLFACGEPMGTDKLAGLLGISRSEIEKTAQELRNLFKEQNLGLEMLNLEGNLQLSTVPENSALVREALEVRRSATLSAAAMEVLSVISYNQPVTKSFVEQVRGVSSGEIVNSLEEKGLIEEAGRLPVPGRPVAYRTTENFLRCFGLSSINDLPPVEALREQVEAEAKEEEDNADERVS